MISNNKAILQQANAAIVAGNHEMFLSFCADDSVWTFIGDKVLKGKEAIRRYMTTAYLEPPKFRVENLVAEGELLIATGKISLKEENGEWIDYEYCDIWRFREGKMCELKAFVI